MADHYSGRLRKFKVFPGQASAQRAGRRADASFQVYPDATKDSSGIAP
jgi:hypothetical protein